MKNIFYGKNVEIWLRRNNVYENDDRRLTIITVSFDDID